MSLTPDNLLYEQLAMLFDPSVIGPGPLVYHSPGGDPTPPYVTYRRTNTEVERDLQGNPHKETVEYEVEVASMFFNDAAVDLSSLDNWTSGTWFFNATNQTISEDQFSITYTLEACSAF